MAEGALDLFAMVSALAGLDDDEGGKDQVERVSDEEIDSWTRDSCCKGLSKIQYAEEDVESFRENFERKNEPVLIDGCAKGWSGFGESRQWDFDALEKRFSDTNFALFNGQQFSLAEYMKYMRGRAEMDENPLYLFEDLSQVDARNPKTEILNAYHVPKFFRQDLFELPFSKPTQTDNLDQEELLKSRPRFRWLLLGPKHSGSKLHQDPIGTSAWNTLLEGTKRWVLFPPDLDDIVTARLKKSLDGCSAATWFASSLPSLRPDFQEHGLIELTQHPGETIFVPGGWWHTVLNLQDTLCVTQNFASEFRLEQVFHEMLQQPSSLFRSAWLKQIQGKFPGRVSVDAIK